MRKVLLSLAVSGIMCSGVISVAASEYTNLTPNFEFRTAETPLQLAASNPLTWNFPDKWIHDNLIAGGDIDPTGGVMVLSGGAPIVNFPNEYKKINEYVRLLDLGGDCGKVWTLNYSGSTIEQTLKTEYDIEADLPAYLHSNGWYQKNHFFFIPDPAVMHKYAGKTLRCRMEVNVYNNVNSTANAFYGYYRCDDGSFDEDDQVPASNNQVTFDEFYTGDKWDATKWRIYEFEFTVSEAPEELSEWIGAPFAKFETDNNLNSCLMIRNVTFYDPEGMDLEPIDRTKKEYVTYTVGNAEPGPVDPEDPFDNADDISDNRFYSKGLLFNKAEAPVKFAAKNSASEWNLASGWIHENVINGDAYNEGGSLILSGDGSIKDYDCLDKFNEHVHLVDLGGTCEKVLAVNFGSTNLSAEFKNNHNINFPANGFTSVWESHAFNLFVVPDHKEMAELAVAGSKTLRVRMEINLFDNDAAESMAFKAWGTNDQGAIDGDDVTYAGEHTVKASDFVAADGKWDPTKWRAYEFDFNVSGAPEDVTTWTECPSIKIDVAGCLKGTLLMRNIYIWEPVASRAAVDTRKTEKWTRYSVGPSTSGVDFISEAPRFYAISGRTVSFTESAEIFDLSGRKVAVCAAGGSVDLPAGFYVCRNISGASDKFILR